MATQKITKATAAAAARDADAGKSYELTDREVRGLMLRVGPKGARWSFRVALRGKPKRWDLGAALLQDPDWYRALAREAHDLCKRGLDPTVHIGNRIGLGISPTAVSREMPTSWTLGQAVDAFLAEKARTRSAATLDDYTSKLVKEREWDALRSWPICEIDDSDVQRVLNAIGARGAYTAAEGTYRIARALFNWCAKPGHRKESGVAKGVITDVKPPDRPRITAESYTESGHGRLGLPTVEELGRMLAIAQSRAMPLLLSTCVELVIRTAVRRMTAAPCARSQIEEIDQKLVPEIKTDGELVAWVIPPYFMKGRKETHSIPSTMPHLIPIPANLYLKLDKCRTLHEHSGDLFFPSARPRRRNQKPKYAHIHPSTISHAFLNMPGVDSTAHDIRRAFATYGMQKLGFSQEDVQIILDHAEGRGGSVLGRHYDYRDHLARKVKIMAAWNEWLDRLAFEAVEKDASLGDRMALRSRIEKNRGKKFEVDDEAEDALDSPIDLGAEFAGMVKMAGALGYRPDFSDPDRPRPFQGLIDMVRDNLARLDAAAAKERNPEGVSRHPRRRPRTA